MSSLARKLLAGGAVAIYAGHIAGGTISGGLLFTAVPIGAAFAARYVIAAVAMEANSGGTAANVTSPTIGGVAATILYVGEGSAGKYGIWLGAYVPTGTTADVTFTFTSGGIQAARCACAGYSVSGLLSTTPSATAVDGTATSNALDGTIACPEDGFALGMAWNFGTTSRTFTWTNLTEDAETGGYATGRSGSWANTHAPGSALRTATYSGTTTSPVLTLIAML